MVIKSLLDEIKIRTDLRPGDIGYVIYMHGDLYKREYNYGIEFETYAAKGFCEFYEKYDPKSNRVWICEHKGRILGFLLLMNREKAAQLRYFLIRPEYRGIGLGSKFPPGPGIEKMCLNPNASSYHFLDIIGSLIRRITNDGIPYISST